MLQNKFFKSTLYILFFISLLIPSSIVLYGIYYSPINSVNSNTEIDLDCLKTYKSLENRDEFEIVYNDIYIFPELQNLQCIGRIKDINFESENKTVTVYKNPKIYEYLSFINLILMTSLLILNKKNFTYDLLSLVFIGLLNFSFIFYQDKNFSLLFIFIVLIYPYLRLKFYLYPQIFLELKEKILKNYPNKFISGDLIKNKNKNFFLIIIFIILCQRISFTNLANWQLDQATNIWIGMKYSISEMPVGLISSINVPNPNGMVLLGKVLSFLPNLRLVSIFLTLFQATILLLIYTTVPTKFKNYFLLIILGLLSNLYLVNASVEFWNQYMMLNINLFFILLVIRLVKNKNSNIAPLFYLLVVISPSLYIAGLIHGISIFVVSIVCLKKITKFQKTQFKNLIAPIALITLFFLIFTWLPYLNSFSTFNLDEIERRNPEPNHIMLLDSIVSFPIDFLFQWSEIKSHEASILTFAEPNEILSPLSRNLQSSFISLHFVFSLFFLIQYFVVFINRKQNFEFENYIKSLSIILFSYLSFAYFLSPALGSYKIGEMDRYNYGSPVQAVGFYSIFIMIIFLNPLIFKNMKIMKNVFIPINKYLLVIFLFLNMLFTYSVYSDNLNYDGERLHNSDVPWNQKIEVIEFIANDWKNFSDSANIPVYYAFDQLEWKYWITEFGDKITPYYKSPFTHGRAFDYELFKSFNLINSQEGIQFREISDSRYIVSYFKYDPPDLSDKTEEHYKFGRLRVTILSDK